jgi:RNA polymerase sigma-70 factor (ECF subfamily)
MENSMIARFATAQESLVGLNETHWIWAAQQGDLEAFNQLVLFYQDRIFSLALRILEDEDTAEDITQTVFLNAFLGYKIISISYNFLIRHKRARTSPI